MVRARHWFKRAFDFCISLLSLIVLAIPLAATALFVALALGRPVLFTQRRTGIGGKPFTLYKFRTMTNARDASGELLPDRERLTTFGKFLRSTSLDELPELWNVLKGDMSLVGPRPLLPEYLPLYSDEQRRRLDVLPGLTGWAQINGRNATSWTDRFAFDVWYVEHQSVWLDLRILLSTVGLVLRRKDISAEGSATMERFKG